MKDVLNKVVKNPQRMFLISCGLKLSGLYLLTLSFYMYVMWIIISINSIYFESKLVGFTNELRADFLENAISVVLEEFIHIIWFIPVLFFCGIYIGKVLLRPFQIIGDYCKNKIEEKEVHYKTDRFSDYKLLSHFSHIFFDYLKEVSASKVLKSKDYPKQYMGIHGPEFEFKFFFNFSILIMFLTIVSGLFFYFISGEIHSGIMDLYFKFIGYQDKTVGYFIEEQKNLFFNVVSIFILIIFISNLILSFHFYGRISGAIFAFFSTMRSFMRGRFSSRVHLIGYTQVRLYGRWFNKYLDIIERKYNENKNITKGKV